MNCLGTGYTPKIYCRNYLANNFKQQMKNTLSENFWTESGKIWVFYSLQIIHLALVGVKLLSEKHDYTKIETL